MRDASLATAVPSAGAPETDPRPPGPRDGARAAVGPGDAGDAGEVVHDLNNLLTVILGGAAALRETLSPTELQEVAAEIDEAGRRAIVLTRRLLTIARLAGAGADVTSIGLNDEESP